MLKIIFLKKYYFNIFIKKYILKNNYNKIFKQKKKCKLHNYHSQYQQLPAFITLMHPQPVLGLTDE